MLDEEQTMKEHPRVIPWWELHFLGQTKSDRLSSSSEELLVSMLIVSRMFVLALAPRNVDLAARTNVLRRHVSGEILSSSFEELRKFVTTSTVGFLPNTRIRFHDKRLF